MSRIEFADRFKDVILRNLDWSEVFEKYDTEDTVFYYNPPYVGYEDHYLVNTSSHEPLVNGLTESKSDWICSYEDLPDGFEGVYVLD